MEGLLLAFVLLQKKDNQKKERKILKTLETVTRIDEPAKEYLAKATSTTSNKEQIVFVLQIHQKTGFVNAKLHLIRNTKFLMAEKKEMGNMRSVGT